MQEWMKQLDSRFDLILIMEHYDISLAVLILKFCWKIEDVIYLRVNEQTKTGTQLSDKAVKGTVKNAVTVTLIRQFPIRGPRH